MKLGKKTRLYLSTYVWRYIFKSNRYYEKPYIYTHPHTHTDIFINIILLCCTKLSVSVDVTEQKNDKWIGLDGVSKCVMQNERMK